MLRGQRNRSVCKDRACRRRLRSLDSSGAVVLPVSPETCFADSRKVSPSLAVARVWVYRLKPKVVNYPCALVRWSTLRRTLQFLILILAFPIEVAMSAMIKQYAGSSSTILCCSDSLCCSRSSKVSIGFAITASARSSGLDALSRGSSQCVLSSQRKSPDTTTDLRLRLARSNQTDQTRHHGWCSAPDFAARCQPALTIAGVKRKMLAFRASADQPGRHF